MPRRGRVPATALYLYGISGHKSGKIFVGDAVGIDGLHPIEALSCGDFMCWTSIVDRREFAERPSRHADDLDWLSRHGLRHQEIVARIAAARTTIPARFGTMFSGAAALLKHVEARSAELGRLMARISGTDEWGVKVFLAPPARRRAAAGARSGKEYLEHKAAHLRERIGSDDAELQRFAAALGGIAAASASPGRIAGQQPGLLWQAAFLVPHRRRRRWDATLQCFAAKWHPERRVDVTGPWPPYSFAADGA